MGVLEWLNVFLPHSWTMPQFPQHFHFVLIAPTGNASMACLSELMETLAFGLQSLGHQTTAALNQCDAQAVNIVLGAHLLPRDFDGLPERSILYNSEQIFPGCPALAGGLGQLVARYETWDYSQRNVQTWAAMGCPHVRLLPTGYVPQLTRIVPATTQDIDVFFYGVVNPRRHKVLQALRAEGLQVEVAGGVYGAERDALIARSKVVLNLHYYPSHIFETARVSYLLANAKAVVAEINPDTDVDVRYAEAVEARPYAQLVEGCLALLGDPEARRQREQRGLAIMQAMPAGAFLAPLVEQPCPPKPGQFHFDCAMCVIQDDAARPGTRLRQDGFNLIGLAQAPVGIGEDLRMFAAMLDELGVPYSIQALSDHADGLRQLQPQFAGLTTERFEVSVVFHNAFNSQRLRQVLPQLFDDQRLVIGYWPWELPDYPGEHAAALAAADMIWCPARFVRDSYLPHTTQPVFAMPLPTRLPIPSSMDFRQRFGITREDFVVLYLIDLESRTERKNPKGTLDAFRRFAAQHDDAWMLLKCHRLESNEAQAWQEALNHPRIRIFSDSLDGPDLAALYQSADCYLSLHRSEGHGRTLVEALQAGLPLVTTDFSAPGEYLRPDTAWLVDWSPTPVGVGDYPYTQGSWWAEPNLAHAAWQLERVYQTRHAIDRERLRKAGQAFAIENLARRYHAVIELCLQPLSTQQLAQRIDAVLNAP